MLAAFVAAVSDDRARVRAALAKASKAGAPARKLREAMRMVHLFGGFPRTLTALEELNGALGARAAPPRAADRTRPSAGRAAFDRVYGRQAGAVRGWLRRLDGDVARWIAEHAYARVLSRPGLAPVERELLAVAALAASRQEKQLVSHVLGASRCGASPEAVRASFAVGASRLPGKERTRLARRVSALLS